MQKNIFKEEEGMKNLFPAYTFRYTNSPEITKENDYITTRINKEHPEGFDNFSLLSEKKYKVGVKATINCEFEGLGCPEIILVNEAEKCDDGVMRYGACFEIVLYKDGVNVWRHYRENGKCSWHKRLGVNFNVTENEKHKLSLEVCENYFNIDVDGQTSSLRVDDIFDDFHIGLTACEGIARIYDFTIND